MSRHQIMAVAICIMLYGLDGFDVLSISFASPGIAEEWGVNLATLGIVLSMELIGMALGSILMGPLADRRGRRPTILLCLTMTSAGMWLASTADGVYTLSAYRFFTGIGIGGMLAATNAMTAEYANERFRDLSVILMATGYPLGIIIGGSIASSLLATFDWRSVFLFGAIVSTGFIGVVWLLLPELIDYLSQRQPPNALARINATLGKMGHPPIDRLPARETQASPNIIGLFTPPLRRTTILMALGYFAHIMTFYFVLKWIPKLVVDMGYAPAEAGGVLVWANVGGATGAIILGLLTGRFPVRLLLIIALVGAAITVSIFGQGQSTTLLQLSLVACLAGMFNNATLVGMYALFARAFPTELRAGGTGLIIGLSRGSAVLGPIMVGFMLEAGFGLPSVALTMACGSLFAALAFSFIRENR